MYRILTGSLIVTAGVLAFHENSRQDIFKYWAKLPQNRLTQDIEQSINSKVNVLDPYSIGRLSDATLRNRLTRIQTMYNKSHKSNHFSMLAWGLVGGLFMPLEFSNLLLLYVGFECLNAGNTLWILFRDQKGLYEPQKYEDLISGYLKLVKILTVASPFVAAWRVQQAISSGTNTKIVEEMYGRRIAEKLTTPKTPTTPTPPVQPPVPPVPPTA